MPRGRFRASTAFSRRHLSSTRISTSCSGAWTAAGATFTLIVPTEPPEEVPTGLADASAVAGPLDALLAHARLETHVVWTDPPAVALVAEEVVNGEGGRRAQPRRHYGHAGGRTI